MIKVGIIGLGAIGERLIKTFIAHPQIEIVAVCDVLEQRVQQLIEQFEGIGAYTNHKTMLDEAELDLVYVAVPPKYHHAVASDVITKGKHILCEKPLANSVEEAADLLQQVQKQEIIHAMNFPLNYSAASNTFAKLIEDEYIGKLRRVELNLHFPSWPRPWQQNEWVASKEQGGFVLEVGIHFIQQIQKIFGPITLKNHIIEFPIDPTASEVAILAILELEGGVPLLINGLSQTAGDEHISFTAFGTDGTLSLLNWSKLKGGKNGESILPLTEDDSLQDSLIEQIVRAIQGEKANIIDFSAGFEAQVILEKLRN